ncbi:MAG: DNA polymerase [Oscillospiraceae bacterium]|nr:DNA polymerase [Oscillospiraceae bacterium]
MNSITIDLETRSDKDISKCGVYAYADTPYFDILLLAYSIDGGSVKLVDLAGGEEIPDEIIQALISEKVMKVAFNVNFERICLSKYLGVELKPQSWHCTMIHCRYLGLPSSLAEAGAVLGIEQQKMAEGKALIKYFCVPYSSEKGVPHFHSPEDAPEKWKTFKEYNIRDVEAEMEIEQKLSGFQVPDFIWNEFYLDQQINDRGILVDTKLANAAIKLDEQVKEKISAKMQELTGIDNPNSVYQLLDWLNKQGYTSDSLGKEQVKELIKKASEPVRSVLEMRLQLSKSSVKKYTAMKNCSCTDNRARGMFSFYGASRTGRFSGRNIQIQNLPQNHLPDLEEARELIKYGMLEDIEILYDNVPDTLSQLIRTAFIPKPGMKFIVADFAQIEMRLTAFYAGEQWVIDTFERGGDIYCETASQMFGVPVKKHGINGHLRQKGKQASLSCSYGGSTGALIAMGAVKNGMKEEELQPLVDAWRAANPNIVQFWYDLDKAAKKVIKEKLTVKTHGLTIFYKSGFMFIELPSKRRLAYAKPKIGENRFGSESITYMGIGTTKKWERLETFGGKLVENCIQAIARDLLLYSMKTLSEFSIVGHVHDELIIECPMDTSIEFVCEQMSKAPSWAKGLLLRADGYECKFYKKD